MESGSLRSRWNMITALFPHTCVTRRSRSQLRFALAPARLFELPLAGYVAPLYSPRALV